MNITYEHNTTVIKSSTSEGFGRNSPANMHNNRRTTVRGSVEEGIVTIGTPTTYGPWGGSGGTIFDDGMYTGIRDIHLARTGGMCYFKVLYDRNGQAVWGNKHGYNNKVGTIYTVEFDFPMEILTHITGYFSTTKLTGPTVIKSLTFHTTKTVHGPYGEESGTFFSSCLTEGRVVGFNGREGWYIDGIGVHVLEGKVLPSQQVVGSSEERPIISSGSFGKSNMLAHALRKGGNEVAYGVVEKPVPIEPGPWGGHGGEPWDSGVYSGIKQILITRGKFIHTIQIEYDRGGQAVWSPRHGGTGQSLHRIRFNNPNEVLNCVMGFYNSNLSESPIVLASISLFSTRGKYGPFGEEAGTYFTSGATEGHIDGFHGRSELYLDAIGVHKQHWHGDRRSSSTVRSALSKYIFGPDV